MRDGFITQRTSASVAFQNRSYDPAGEHEHLHADNRNGSGCRFARGRRGGRRRRRRSERGRRGQPDLRLEPEPVPLPRRRLREGDDDGVRQLVSPVELLRTLQLDHQPDDRQPRVRERTGAGLLRLLGQRPALLQRRYARLAPDQPRHEQRVQPDRARHGAVPVAGRATSRPTRSRARWSTTTSRSTTSARRAHRRISPRSGRCWRSTASTSS